MYIGSGRGEVGRTTRPRGARMQCETVREVRKNAHVWSKTLRSLCVAWITVAVNHYGIVTAIFPAGWAWTEERRGEGFVPAVIYVKGCFFAALVEHCCAMRLSVSRSS